MGLFLEPWLVGMYTGRVFYEWTEAPQQLRDRLIQHLRATTAPEMKLGREHSCPSLPAAD